jgi:hypothetical protein
MTELDYGQALVFLEKAIGEKSPDYVYKRVTEMTEEEEENGQSCLYFEQGQPSCIVGHVLSYMGINSAPEGSGAGHALTQLGVHADPKTKALLEDVQERQDDGVPWGEALRKAQFGDDA